jgi:hypothetical protein
LNGIGISLLERFELFREFCELALVGEDYREKIRDFRVRMVKIPSGVCVGPSVLEEPIKMLLFACTQRSPVVRKFCL